MEKRLQKKPAARKAATPDVLGTSLADKVPPKWREYYDALIEMRSLVRRRKRSQLGTAKRQNLRYSQHMADVATNSFEKDLALSRASSQQDVLFEIGAALDRIEEGTFGLCEMTGKAIEPERLDAIPWTRFCGEAERELEAKGQIKRPRVPAPRKIGRSSTSNRVGEVWDEQSEPATTRSRKKRAKP